MYLRADKNLNQSIGPDVPTCFSSRPSTGGITIMDVRKEQSLKLQSHNAGIPSHNRYSVFGEWVSCRFNDVVPPTQRTKHARIVIQSECQTLNKSMHSTTNLITFGSVHETAHNSTPRCGGVCLYLFSSVRRTLCGFSVTLLHFVYKPDARFGPCD